MNESDTELLRGNLKEKKSIFKDIIQNKVDNPTSYPIFDKLFLDAIASLVFGHDCQSLTHGPFAIIENFFNSEV